MDRITMAKIACAIVGFAIFAYGARIENATVRWVGIAFVVAAFLLRFVKRRTTDEPQ